MSDIKTSNEASLQVCLHKTKNKKLLGLVEEIQARLQCSRSQAAYEILRHGYYAIEELKKAGKYDPQPTETV